MVELYVYILYVLWSAVLACHLGTLSLWEDKLHPLTTLLHQGKWISLFLSLFWGGNYSLSLPSLPFSPPSLLPLPFLFYNPLNNLYIQTLSLHGVSVSPQLWSPTSQGNQLSQGLRGLRCGIWWPSRASSGPLLPLVGLLSHGTGLLYHHIIKKK